MSEHPLEATTPGKLLLLTSKFITPLMLLVLVVVTPAFVKRALLLDSLFLDWVLRLLAAALLIFTYWSLPDLAHSFNAQRRGWSTRIWAQLASYDRGRFFEPVYFGLAGVLGVAAALLTGWALHAFLPGSGGIKWFFAILLGLQVPVMYLLQYPWVRKAVSQFAAPASQRLNRMIHGAARPIHPQSPLSGYTDDAPNDLPRD